MFRLNPKWISEIENSIIEGRIKAIDTENSKVAQAYVLMLSKYNIPVKVVNLGAGVKRCIPAEQVCSCCGGKGYK
jgi:hypothetical protein